MGHRVNDLGRVGSEVNVQAGECTSVVFLIRCDLTARLEELKPC